MIQPMRGVKSRLRSLRWLYALTAPVYPFLQKTLGRWVTSTDLLAAAMLQLAIAGSEKKALNTAELNEVAGRRAGAEGRAKSLSWSPSLPRVGLPRSRERKSSAELFVF